MNITDLPTDVLGAHILAVCKPGATRSGVRLPVVCKAFQQALDTLDFRVWGDVKPCLDLSRQKGNARLKVGQLRSWLLRQGPAIRDLDLSLATADLFCSIACTLQGLKHVKLCLRDNVLPMSYIAPLTTLQSLALDWTTSGQGHEVGLHLRLMTQLTNVFFSSTHSGRSIQSFRVAFLSPLSRLCSATLDLPNDGHFAELMHATSLTHLAVSLPMQWQSPAEVERHSLGCIPTLEDLAMLPHSSQPVEGSGEAAAVPTHAALRGLTRLTALRLQIWGVEPESGSLQPSITALRRLQTLHCVGRLDSNIFELPSGFTTLDCLSRLTLEEVHFASGHLQVDGGLPALSTLHVLGCSGMLPFITVPQALRELQFEEAEDLRLPPQFASQLQHRFEERQSMEEVSLSELPTLESALGAVDGPLKPALSPLPAFAPPVRCKIVQSWDRTIREVGSAMLPAITVHLPPLDSVVFCRPPAWRGFPGYLSQQSLQEVDFLGCDLHTLPRQLAAATALRRLRIVQQGDVLHFKSYDLELLSMLPRLKYVNVAKENARHRNSEAVATAVDGLPRWRKDDLAALMFILWQLRNRGLCVTLQEPEDWQARDIGAAEAAPRVMAGRICLTTALVSEWGQRRGCLSGGDTHSPLVDSWADLAEKLWVALNEWLITRFPLGGYQAQDAAAAREDAADWLKQWELHREAHTTAYW